MRLQRFALACWLTSTAVLAHAQQPQIPTFTADVDMVSVAVAVVDDDGNFVTNLTADQFTVYEDGKSQEIHLFAADPRGRL